ncbi:hypothetical protein GURASL_18240 [Geotalea uraniireducens]|uniref:Uncharacterized protein n=1 Tax=Geotalea uraniireducens TaxID=351604 RepID=A0ABM8EKC1_9BACT|nr:hypothetical protein [Geotalea uraniireducens]BDV42901.1 hypothetical protein GURASL_18240 [Geotalea uraniireducens]
MDAALLAKIGLSRLRLPIPLAKLAIIHGVADALQNDNCQHELWDDFIKWISSLELESEVAEALCIAVLAKNTSVVSGAKLQLAINRPSPLSDLLLYEISGHPLLINSWSKAHSGEVPPLFTGREEIEELTEGRIVPPILATRMTQLEKHSRRHFLRQWAYEFCRLRDSTGCQSDGHWEYFIGNNRDRATGQFITCRGQLARSAYLRTLSLAVDQWDMPEDIAIWEARYATPADLSFLKMLPGMRPNWTDVLYAEKPSTLEEWQKVLSSVVNKVVEDTPNSVLLHLNTPIFFGDTYNAEVELITCLHDEKYLSPEEMMKLHRFLPGQFELPRTKDWDFFIHNKTGLEGFLTMDGGVRILPALLPCAAQFVGYLQFDLVGRMPYLPANYSSSVPLIGTPRKGGMDLTMERKHVGEFQYWNHQWSPTHDKALDASCGISLILRNDACKELWSVAEMTPRYYWKATVLKRESDYGKWEEKTIYGSLP